MYQPVITPTRWTMFCVRMIGAEAFGSKSSLAAGGIGSNAHVGAAAQQPRHRPLSDPGVQVGRPEVGGLWISITELTHGVVQSTGR